MLGCQIVGPHCCFGECSWIGTHKVPLGQSESECFDRDDGTASWRDRPVDIPMLVLLVVGLPVLRLDVPMSCWDSSACLGLGYW